MPPTPPRPKRKKRPSRKLIAANRRNALKSTGPRTPAGRQIVSRNALKHGLAANVPLLPTENPAAHAAYCREIVEAFAPANPPEHAQAQSIANDLWRLERIPGLELGLLAAGSDACHSPDEIALAEARSCIDHIHSLLLLSSYEQRIQRHVGKQIAQLRQTIDLRAKNTQNGFVCQNRGSPPQIIENKPPP